jgi:uncharacterized membrane protein
VSLESLITSGRIADIILVLMAAEALAAFVWLRQRGRVEQFPAHLARLLAGMFLVLALRFALVGGGWLAIAICLALALLSHLAEVWVKQKNLAADDPPAGKFRN